MTTELRTGFLLSRKCRQVCLELLGWIDTLPTRKHPLLLIVRNRSVVQGNGREVAFGTFRWPEQSPLLESAPLEIQVAGRLPKIMMRAGCTEDEAWDELRYTILHEYAHYEQWARGDEPNEEGAEERANELLRLFKERGA